MMRSVYLKHIGFALMIAVLSTPGMGEESTVFTDADASVRVICRNDADEAACLTPLGTAPYVRVHDQNQLESGYWHFDLSGIPAGAQVNSAKFQLDTQTNSWGDTSVTVVAIADADNDWDLNLLPEDEINGVNAPYADIDAFPWSGDPDADGLQRFNAPTPFLDEGERASDNVRLLVPELDSIFIENQDANTDGEIGDPGNEYGGYAGADGPGTGGSADNGDNIWPVKNAIDLDITDLVQWKLGQNAAYSDLEPKDHELTLMVRTEVGAGTNGFVRFISKESVNNTYTLDPDGEPALEPGRIVVSFEGGITIDGDFDRNGALELADVNMLTANIAAGGNDAALDLNGDNVVNQADLNAWVTGLKNTWIGDSNLDGEFNSSDFVAIFGAGKFELDVDAGWEEGDWTGDRRFSSGDLVAAFSDGGFELGPRQASAVPEPSAVLMLVLATIGLLRWRAR